MSDSQNLSVAGYADNASPSSPEVEGPNRDAISSPIEENESQTKGDPMELEENEVIDVEQTPTEPFTTTTNPTEVLDVAPLDISTFTIQPVTLQPAQNISAPRNLTPFPSPFPSVPLLLPPPFSSSSLASTTNPLSSSFSPANTSHPPSTLAQPTSPQFSEREVAAWNSLMGELGEEGDTIRLREEQEKDAAALDVESTDITHRRNIQSTGVVIQEPFERLAAAPNKKRKARTASKGQRKSGRKQRKGGRGLGEVSRIKRLQLHPLADDD